MRNASAVKNIHLTRRGKAIFFIYRLRSGQISTKEINYRDKANVNI